MTIVIGPMFLKSIDGSREILVNTWEM